ncbi:MAG: type II/IV secretion system protein [Selenomonadaceae bacterium]|nr:type II/IV secretion system protein [Selenomonadaceae bacterium]
MSAIDERFSELLPRAIYNSPGRASIGISDLVDFIFKTAIDLKSSDVHFEPIENFLRIRYRIDGKLVELHEKIPRRIQSDIISRVKILAKIDTSEVHSPLDGQIRFDQIDIRVASIPTHFGDLIVCRILDSSIQLKTIDELGMNSETEKIFRQLIHSQNGLFVVVGAMGTGKSTTLHAALRELNSPEIHIATLEDPIEQIIDGIDQTEIQGEIDFATGLRALLRMDCNCLMVGEMRDEETARIAVRAALTGHLVLTTLHATDSFTAITRLIEMGVEPYLLAATLIGTMSQKLVRRICPECNGRGCDSCRGTGFSGRIGIYEILPIDSDLRDAIKNFRDEDQIRSIVPNFKSMREDGLEKVRNGLTTIDEIETYTGNRF